ncbi:hypothetical protein FF1_030600 [Malus domestica]
MFNILLCDAELRLYELESLRVGLNLAKFGTRKTLESHSKSIMQMDRSHQSTLLPLCYMILYIRYMLSPECLSAYCLLLWSTAGHAASGTGEKLQLPWARSILDLGGLIWRKRKEIKFGFWIDVVFNFI